MEEWKDREGPGTQGTVGNDTGSRGSRTRQDTCLVSCVEIRRCSGYGILERSVLTGRSSFHSLRDPPFLSLVSFSSSVPRDRLRETEGRKRIRKSVFLVTPVEMRGQLRYGYSDHGNKSTDLCEGGVCVQPYLHLRERESLSPERFI